MLYGWNPAKRASNIAKHGVDFAAVEGFEWETATVAADTRQHYGEVRLGAVGVIGTRVNVLLFTLRRPVVWVISLRKANMKEATRYATDH